MNFSPPQSSPVLYTQLLDAVDEAVVARDLSNTITYWNRSAEHLFGWTADEVLGRNVIDVTSPETTREQAREAMECLREGRSWTGEFLMQRCDGSVFRASVTDTPIFDESGMLTGVVAVSRDVSPKDRAGEEVALERLRLQYILEHAPAFMFVLQGESYVYEMANAAFCDLVGRRDVIGKPLLEVFPEVDGQGYLDMLDEVRRTGERFVGKDMAIRFRRGPDGKLEKRFVNFVFSPIKSMDGASFDVLVHGVDVTIDVAGRMALQHAFHANQMVMDHSLDVICTIDREGRFVQVSAACEWMWGYSEEELIGRNYRTLVYDEDAEKTEQTYCSVLDGAGVRHFENRYVASDGRVVDMLWSWSWSELDEHFFLVGSDITEEKAKERALAAGNQALWKSEQRLRALVNVTAQVVWTGDEEGNTIDVSDAWEKLTGRNKSEADGWGWAEALHPDDRPGVLDVWREHLETKEACEVEYRIRTKDGSYRWLHARKVPVFNEEGSFVEWVGACSDINAQKQAEAALRASEARYRTIVDTAHEGVWLVDAQARTTFVNTRLASMLGYSPEEMQGRKFSSFMVEEEQEAAAAKFEQRKRGVSETYDVRFRCRDGSIIWTIISASPFYDEANGFAGSLGMVTDITSRKKHEQELTQAKEQAEEMSRLKSSFLANMSHEIRTPLTAILSCSEMLVEEVAGEHREMAEMIGTSGERLLETLTSVLDLAQLESGVNPVIPESIDVAGHVRETVQVHEVKAAANDVDLTTSIPDKAVWAMLDGNALERIVSNLLTNAIKFSPGGSVRVSLEAAGTDVHLTVADTGIGISDDFLPRIFDEFTQESVGISRTFEGNGLGLAITKRLIDGMGGTVHATSKKHEGSTMHVRLPRGLGNASFLLMPHQEGESHNPEAEPDDARPDQPEDDLREVNPAVEKTPLVPRRVRTQVLVVEDNYSAQKVFKRLLADDYDAAFASNGRDALSLADRYPYDIILLDIQLGDSLNGDDVLHALRGRKGYEDACIIAVTAYAMPNDYERFLSMGFSGYVSKPFKRADLENALRMAFHLRAAENVDSANEVDRRTFETLLEVSVYHDLIDRYEWHGERVILIKGAARFQFAIPQASTYLRERFMESQPRSD